MILHFSQQAIDESIFLKQNKTKRTETKQKAEAAAAALYALVLRIHDAALYTLYIDYIQAHIHCLNTTPSRYTFLSLPSGTLLRWFAIDAVRFVLQIIGRLFDTFLFSFFLLFFHSFFVVRALLLGTSFFVFYYKNSEFEHAKENYNVHKCYANGQIWINKNCCYYYYSHIIWQCWSRCEVYSNLWRLRTANLLNDFDL